MRQRTSDTRARKLPRRNWRSAITAMGASAVTLTGVALASCPAGGACSRCGLCAGLLPVVVISGVVTFLGTKR